MSCNSLAARIQTSRTATSGTPTAIDQLFADEQVADDLVLWALTDQQGTVRDLATHDSTAHTTTVVLHRNYDAYGTLVSASGTLLDGYPDEGSIRLTTAATDALFNYTGRFFDAATWLQYNLNRWYDAQTGRWMSEDPIGFEGDPWNLYRYVGNSPLDSSDPSGLIKTTFSRPTDDPYEFFDEAYHLEGFPNTPLPGGHQPWETASIFVEVVATDKAAKTPVQGGGGVGASGTSYYGMHCCGTTTLKVTYIATLTSKNPGSTDDPAELAAFYGIMPVGSGVIYNQFFQLIITPSANGTVGTTAAVTFTYDVPTTTTSQEFLVGTGTWGTIDHSFTWSRTADGCSNYTESLTGKMVRPANGPLLQSPRRYPPLLLP